MPEVEEEYTPKEIRWGGYESRCIAFGAPVVPLTQALPEGTVMARYESGDNAGRFDAYDPAATNGLEIARGILARIGRVSTRVEGYPIYVAGVFKESELESNLDVQAKQQMNGRSYWNGALILGGGGAW